MSRAEFHTDLRAVRGALVNMTITASEAIRHATDALLDLDQTAAATAKALDERLHADQLGVETRTYQLIALQQPVASDLRELVSGVKIAADGQRMGSLARHVAEVAQRLYPERSVPAALVPTFRKMGDVAARIAEGAAITLNAYDAQDAGRLEIDDDAMDGLRRTLFRALVDNWPYGVETAVNVALLGRYYERFADHAVAIAQSVVYIVTGIRAD